MLALVLTVPVGEAELAADALWALGVAAVEERSVAGTGDDAGAGTGTEDQFVELWTSLGDDAGSVTRAAEAFPARWRWHTVEVDDAVVNSWREHATPSWVTPDLVVIPDWIDTQVPPDVTALRIDPGPSFGLGDHPTTVLSLRALRGVLWPEATVLDVGCGSGVLAVAAAVLGAPYVEAVDISTAAVDATRANADRNGVARQIVASTRPLHELGGPFDVVVANILAPALVELAPELRRLTAPSGVLIVSGILESSHDHVLEALAPMQVIDQLTREGWSAVVLRH
jgi:ribosomal protein L11 methyltransferase